MSSILLARETAKAIHNRLSTHVGVMSVLGDPARLYDAAPEDPLFPYLTYGDVKIENQGGDDVDVVLQKLSLHVWSRYQGRSEVLEILATIISALESAPLSLDSGTSLIATLPYTDVLRAPDGRTMHGVVRVHLYAASVGVTA